MKLKRTLCAALAGALLLAGLSACAGQTDPQPTPTPAADDVAYQTTGMGRDTVLFTVNDTPVTADEYLYWLLSSVAAAKQSGHLADDAAWEDTIDGTPTADYLKDAALDTALLYIVTGQQAEQAGLQLTQEEQDELDMQMDNLEMQLLMYYGVTMDDFLEQQCITLETYRRQMVEIPTLAQKMMEDYEARGELTPTDEDMDAMLEENQIYTCKHILLAFPENEDGSAATDEQKAAVKAEADALLAQIRADADPAAAFDTSMEARSDDGRDPETKKLYKPEGYTFYADGYLVDGTGGLVSEFVTAGAALEVGEISQPVETDYGYHILMRVDSDNEQTRALYSDYAMNLKLGDWIDQAKVEKTDAYAQLDPKLFYDNMLELARQWQEELAAQQEAAAQSPAPETDSPEAGAESPAAQSASPTPAA